MIKNDFFLYRHNKSKRVVINYSKIYLALSYGIRRERK